MDSRFLELCGREFERGVARMFDNAPRIPGTGLGEIPVVGGRFFLAFATPPELIEMVAMALCARERFRQDVSEEWPDLPLHETDIEAAQCDDSNRRNLVGYYADSLKGEFWDYELHPRFPVFASGLLSCKTAPVALRSDRSLLKEFPPSPLAGMCDDWLTWRSPQRLVERRKHLAMVAAHEAAMGNGRSV